jgi:hypothetical protein
MKCVRFLRCLLSNETPYNEVPYQKSCSTFPPPPSTSLLRHLSHSLKMFMRYPNNLLRLIQILSQTRRQKTVIPDRQFLIQSLNVNPRHIVNMHHRPTHPSTLPFFLIILIKILFDPWGPASFSVPVDGRRRRTQA